jgi:hypothetical protein
VEFGDFLRPGKVDAVDDPGKKVRKSNQTVFANLPQQIFLLKTKIDSK